MMAASRSPPSINWSQVKEQLNSGADVNAKDKNGNTWLHYAASQGNVAILLTLLLVKCNGAFSLDVNVRDRQGRTALMLAAEHKSAAHEQVLQILLEAKNTPGFNARMQNAKLHRENCRRNVNINAQDGAGQIALMKAAYRGALGGQISSEPRSIY